MFLHDNQFCVTWKSEGVSFKKANTELKDNFKIYDNHVTEENVNSHFNYEIISKRRESHLTNFIVYDLETHNTDRARPYCIYFYRLSKIAGRYQQDPTQEELKKSTNDTLSFVGDNCVGNALDFLVKLRGEKRKVKNKIDEDNLQLHAHNGSGYDT